MWGLVALGAPPSTLLLQGRAAGFAAHPARSMCGQVLDLALILADGSAKGTADPAFEAHTGPMGRWAMAVWNGWLPMLSLSSMMQEAMTACQKARQPWRIAYGPAAATYLSAVRLGWSIVDATTWITDRGMPLDLRIDPPWSSDKCRRR